ncbi:MAG TPA: M12 family metallo-peptidase [Steroidobacter sp.]|jgi:hypothetical protein|nr:M12 family metallo-peptidase [Steroidobacteraceae bacterium]HLS80895.1 M12 family metallo-peptidase [Steroidobacter sp.]
MRNRRGHTAGKRIGWMLAFAAACITPAEASAADTHILRAEPVRSITPDRDVALRKSGPSGLKALRFEAYGRRFDLSLDANRELLGAAQATHAKAQPSSLQLYRGDIEGVAGTWVRLAIKDGVLEGMLWDGVHLYAIEPTERVRASFAPGLDVGAAQSVIFKLADVRIDASEASCAAVKGDAPQTGAQAYESLSQELGGAALLDSADVSMGLKVSTLSDALFFERHGGAQQARDAILVRLNNVDGIFSSQLGMRIQPSTILVDGPVAGALSGASKANDLLAELGWLRERTPELHSAGLTHLFTGRDLNDSTVGIAYLDHVCDRKYGASLTEVRNGGAWRDSLVAAHEIGHNFGASHDGEPGGSCPNVPGDAYLMAASVSGADQFSQCSLDTIRSRIHRASCVSMLSGADMEIAQQLGEIRQPGSRAFEWRLQTTNIGGLTAQRVRAQILIPPDVLVEDAYVIGGSCTSGAGRISCELGSVPGGATRTINLTLRSDVLGASSIAARIDADNDVAPDNNAGEGSLLIGYEADVALMLDAPQSAATGAELELNFEIRNSAGQQADAVIVTIEPPPSFTVRGASLQGGECSSTQSDHIRCSISLLDSGAAASGTVSLLPTTAGIHSIHAHVAGSYYDPSPANNSVEHVVRVDAAPQASAQDAEAASSKGGGGAVSWPLILALLGGLGWRAAQQRAANLL